MLLALLASLALQEARTETWPNGNKKCTYEVVLDETGAEVRQGPFQSWFESGGPESEGHYEHGKESGAWVFSHPNGQRAATGHYADGLQSGPWETFFPDGSAESKGSYVRGTRNGRWTYWREDGTKDLDASGLYKFEVYRSKGDDGHHYRGYHVDNKRQGAWASYWPERAGEERRVQLEGEFAAGARTGRWFFRHPDGVVSSLLLTGEYVDGTWAEPVEVPEPPPFMDSAYPELEPSPRGWPEDREHLTIALRAALVTRTIGPELGARLEGAGPRALPIALELVRALDPEKPADRVTLGFLEDQVLRRLCAGHVLSPSGAGSPSQASAARELVRAWLSLWMLTHADLDFWESEVPGPAGGLRDLLQDPPLLERDTGYAPEARAAAEARRSVRSTNGAESAQPSENAEAASSSPRTDAYHLRFGKEKENLLRTAASGTKESVARALAWLAAHQAPDGRWSNAFFSAECERRGKEPCAEPGNVNYDVGVSGLALLAFLGDGYGPNEGTYAEVVARGLAWLVSEQTSEGLLGERGAHDFLYGHAIATAALCEGYGLGGGGLRAAAERALAFLLLGRFPGFAWRYDVPGTEPGDTSVTGWAVNALLAARHAGLTVDDEAFVGALAWIELMAEPHTGRVGYTDRGELSSRNSENEGFPRTLGEAMTAVGLLIRLQLGQRPLTTPALVGHAKLLAAKPPVIDKQWGADQYHWYYATCALHEYGAPFWEPWEDELRKTVILAQVRLGEAEGSWDPLGPWASAMGRACTTALLTLALECPYRYPRAMN